MKIAGASLLQLGAPTGREGPVFGEIVDVTTDASGRIHILDGLKRTVFSFVGGGDSAIETLGGPGAGPGEFLRPRVILAIPGVGLMVGENTGDVSVFRRGPDGGLHFSHGFRHDGSLWDMCSMGGAVYIHGMRPGDASALHVHGLDPAGNSRFVASFGEVYRTPNRIVQRQISRGRIACLDHAGIVLLAPAMLPEVRAYDPDGRLLWWLEIADVLALPLFELPSGGSRMVFPESGWHSTLSLVASEEGRAALLQVGHLVSDPVRQRSVTVRLHPFLIEAERRDGRYLGDTWPRVLHWQEDRIYAVREDPFPELLVFQTAP